MDLNGSISVTPVQTTPYTLTATGPGGTVTQSVAVAVLQVPTVSFSAEPPTIQSGQLSILRWSTAYADSVRIDPGIGAVAPSGSLAVSPAQTTTYTITATSTGGSMTASFTVAVSPIFLQITSPLPDETVSGRSVTVRGIIENQLGNETGVTVNGRVAQTYGNAFVANYIPLNEGTDTLTATATDTAGNSVEASVAVTAFTSDKYLKISSNIDSGISPMVVNLRVSASFGFDAAALSYSGPGAVQILESKDQKEFKLRITGEGLYYFTAEARDPGGNPYKDTVGIVLWNQEQLDALLRAKWQAMKDALGNRDISKALGYLSEDNRKLYTKIYTLLDARLPEIAQQMRELELVQVEGGVAEYRIKKNEVFNGQSYDISHHVYFILGKAGLWEIYRY